MTSSHPGAEAQVQSQVPNQCSNLDNSPSQIASRDRGYDVRISPDGSLILYQVNEFDESSNCTSSALWIAETNTVDSAIQLTSGGFNDHGGIFHPDGTRILFLLDREALGEASHIYTLALGGDGTPDEPGPHILTSGLNRVQGFEVSLDGNQVAFLSLDENSAGVNEFPRLWVYNFCCGIVCMLENIWRDRHIEAFTWGPTSQCLLYRLCNDGEVLLESISIVGGNPEPRSQGSYLQLPSGPNIWLALTCIASLQSFGSGSIPSVRVLVIHGLPIIPMDQEPADPPSGDDEDVVRILRTVSILDPTPAQNMGPGMPAMTLLPPQTPQTLLTEYTGTSSDQNPVPNKACRKDNGGWLWHQHFCCAHHNYLHDPAKCTN
ncbi:hypothetical protein P691DRAFT_768236 [Macrolepiota fuliginosa MF-IS2]|uniref:Dipeptidylpeptidase IV N-terminal domain-containing protein n=1 Tax=Macrolepiota fuliginosa MF-IS2 TaxID=1400762 RepID=A0A9P5WYK0_9AGAR|nr:hypothetical protein P691DRAFT_768236 [Macrolepiota fuliginosa MF-IS2]